MVGELVMERFRVLERIGSGGMGTVYRAFDERLQRQVAVKEIAGGAAERVLREAQASARLNHPGIVTLYELGAAGKNAVLVSELVEGSTLAELTRAGELSDRDVAELGADVCDALAHAHERGVVHRDIKPQNIIVRADDDSGRRAKLMDFGIAALSGAPTLTATGQVVGTLAYMAPEQAEGERPGHEADVYSLALTLYECWAGTNPVVCATPAATARAIGAPLPSLREHRPDLPELLTDRIDACLVPYPDDRPPLAALHNALTGSASALDSKHPLPVAEDDEDRRMSLSGVGLVASLTTTAGLAFLGGPAGHPDLAMLLAVIAALAAGLLGVTGQAVVPSLAALAALAAWGPDAFAPAVIFVPGGLAFAPILSLRHIALALLAAVLWAAAVVGLSGLLIDGGMSGPPQLVAVLAVVAVGLEFAGRAPRTRPARTVGANRAPRTA